MFSTYLITELPHLTICFLIASVRMKVYIIDCVRDMITNIIGADTNPNDPKNMFAMRLFLNFYLFPKMMRQHQISIATTIDEYLEVSNATILPGRVETVVLQNVLGWLHSEHLDLRCIAAKILLALARNPENRSIVDRQLVVGLSNILDSELIRREPAEGSHGQVVGAAVMDGELLGKVVE